MRLIWWSPRRYTIVIYKYPTVKFGVWTVFDATGYLEQTWRYLPAVMHTLGIRIEKKEL